MTYSQSLSAGGREFLPHIDKTVKRMSKNIHVTHRNDNAWAVIREKAEKASKIFPTQEKAIEWGRPIAKADRVEFVIHDTKNRIRDKDSYGNDFCPPKDKKY